MHKPQREVLYCASRKRTTLVTATPLQLLAGNRRRQSSKPCSFFTSGASSSWRCSLGRLIQASPKRSLSGSHRTHLQHLEQGCSDVYQLAAALSAPLLIQGVSEKHVGLQTRQLRSWLHSIALNARLHSPEKRRKEVPRTSQRKHIGAETSAIIQARDICVRHPFSRWIFKQLSWDDSMSLNQNLARWSLTKWKWTCC